MSTSASTFRCRSCISTTTRSSWLYGAAIDRRLGIAGEELAGSFSATDFVAWYSGHPDTQIDRFTLDATDVVVVGVGNVAVDVARILAKTAEDLRPTDLPDHVLDVLEASHVTDIHVLGRRGPAQAKFTTKELRELGELVNADIVVREDELRPGRGQRGRPSPATPASGATSTSCGPGPPRSRAGSRAGSTCASWCGRRRSSVIPRSTGSRSSAPQLDGTGNVKGTGDLETIPAQMVLRSVGYRGQGLDGLPFDERSGTIPNEAGRVLHEGGPVPGEYVAGWIKRGPTGVIGTNKSDASETITSLIADAPNLTPAPDPRPAGAAEAAGRARRPRRRLGRLGRHRRRRNRARVRRRAANGSRSPTGICCWATPAANSSRGSRIRHFLNARLWTASGCRHEFTRSHAVHGHRAPPSSPAPAQPPRSA